MRSETTYACLFCGASAGPFDRICGECREAFLNYKKEYFMSKKLLETTELDEEIFKELYEAAAFDEICDDPLYEEKDIPEIIKDARSLLAENAAGTWLTQKEGRMDRFIEYIEKRIQKTFAEKKKNEPER